jgi:sugar phosphate permease
MSQDINNTATASKTRRVIKNLRWYVLVLFLLGVTVNYITRNSLGILAPELKESLGITTEQYSWIVGAFQIAYTIFQPLCGWLIDHRPEDWLYGLRESLGADVYFPCGSRKLAASCDPALLYGRLGSGCHPG